MDHLIFEGGVGRIEKKISCRAVTTEKEIMQHRWPRKKNAYTNCEAKKNFVPSQEMLYGKDVPQEI